MLTKLNALLLAILLLGAFASLAPAADYFKGRETYAQHCESCHGTEGRSLEPGVPNFSSGDAMFLSDADLYKKVRGGTASMPAYRGILSDSEIRDVIAYLRSFEK